MVEALLTKTDAAAGGEIVFIDPAVADLAGLLRGLRADVRPIVLDAAGDPVRQMADALAGLGGLRAIHIIAHGSPGKIGFTGGSLSFDTLVAHARDLARIGAALGLTGELLVWSCDTAKGARGDRFLAALCWATGALVAAATGPVGATTRGGRWNLDARRGAQIVPMPLTATGVAAYQGVMATKTWKTPGTSGNWGTSGAWSPSGVPVAGDDVTIGASGTPYTVTLNSASSAALDSLTINSGATLAVGTNTLNVNGTGSGATDTITLASGGAITIAGGTINATALADSGTLSGSGTIASAVSGTGTITASAGTLNLTGTVSSGPIFTIATASASVLEFSGTATIGAVTINNANQTLRVGAAGNLTISAAETVSLGKILMSGGTLTDASGLTIGTSGTLTGFGKVNPAIIGPGSGSGTITASGGTLELTSAVSLGAGTLALTVGSGASDKLLLDAGSAATSLTFSGSTGTLELNTSGTLTLANALAVGANAVKFDGASSTLTDAGGVTVSTGTITGLGKVAAAVTASGAAHITANGGTLEVTGAITDSGSALVLTITGATDKLLLDAASAAHTVTFSSSGTLELNTSGTLTVGTAMAVGTGTVKLDAAGTTQLTDASGITIAGGTISGTGTISATTAVTGSGTVAIPISNNSAITASGGTLNLTGTVTSGTYAIATASASVLEFSGTATTGAVTINNANQTLQVGASGNLTLTAGETVSLGKIQMSGGTLADASGITLGSGTNSGFLTGFGKVSGNIAKGGSGTTNTLTASGGTLEITGTVTGVDSLTIGGGATDTLKLDAASSATSLSFAGSTGTLELNTSGTLTLANALAVGANTVKLDGASSTLTDAGGVTVSTGTITGLGKVAAAITASGAAHITANGGTLEVTGAIVDSGSALGLTITGASDKLLLDAASVAHTVTFSSSGTLELNTSGTLTVGTAMAVGAGTVKLDGAGTTQLTDTAGLTVAGGTITGTGTISATTAVTGAGTIAIPISNNSSITASGGALNLTGTVTSGTFAIATGSASVLEFSGTATTGAISINNANQTLQVGPAGNLAISAAESITNGKILMSGGTLNDASGVTIGSGATLSGQGTVTANLAGSGTITASGGTLTLSGMVSSGPAFTIDTVSASDLKFTGTATATSAIAINNANQTLEIGSGGNLTISAAESITNGKIVMSGGALSDASGLTVGSGAMLTGFGTVNPAVTGPASGTGTITASGGTIELKSAVSLGAGALALTVGSGASDKLLLDAASSATSLGFSGSTGTLELNTSSTLTLTNALAIGANTVKLDGASSQLTDNAGISLSTGTITGIGKVTGAITATGAASIAASGGTLEIASAITNNGSLALTLGNGASSKLLLDTASAATSVNFSGATGTLEIGPSASLTVANAMTVAAGTVKLDGTASTLTDTAGSISLTSGTITGAGKVVSAISATGAASITASGGTLEVTGAITDIGNALALTITGASDKLLLDAASVAKSGSFNGSTGTLEIGASGSLTVANALSVAAGTVQLDGSGTQLTDNAGISVSSGTIIGLGKVSGAITATGAATITAGGGTLEIASAITNSGSLALTIGSGTGDKLLLDAASAANSLTFAGSTGTLELNAAGTLSLTTALSAGGNTVKLGGAGTTQLTDAAGITIAGGTISGTGLLSASTNVTGAGTLGIGFTSGSNTITASGGTLDITGSVTASETLAVANVAGSVLKLDHSGVTVGPVALDSGYKTLEIAQSATISGVQTIAGGTLTVDSGAVLTDISGIALSGGPLNGAGSISATTAVSGHGAVGLSVVGRSVTASGGSLDVTGNMDTSSTLAIANVPGSVLKLDHSGVTVGPVVLDSGNKTLEIAQGATISGAQTIAGGTLTVDSGAVLTDTSGIALSGGTLDGAGSVAANTNLSGSGAVGIGISSSGTITAAGGTLDLTGTISGRTLAIDSASASVLQIDGSATTGNAIAISDSHQTLKIGPTGALTITAAESITNGTIQLAGGALTDASGLTIGSGAALTGSGTAGAITLSGGTVAQLGGTLNLASITGQGTVNGVTGAGTMTASGGTLDLAGTISGAALAIDSGSASVLKIDGSATTGSAIAINDSRQTLEIGAGGTLTITAAESITNGTIQLDGGTLTGAAGLTIGSGAVMIGSGFVYGPITGSGIVEAHGGTLHLESPITNPAYEIDANSVLQIDNSVASNGVTFDFLSPASGALDLSSDTGFIPGNTDVISGLDVGTGGVRTNFIDLQGAPGISVTGISYGPGNTSGVITLSDGAVLNLANIAGASGAQHWFANWGSDGASGTDLYLNSVACFCTGTRIRTNRGDVAVERLSIGDLAVTLSGEAKPIRWIGRRSYPGGVIADRKVLPIKIAASAIGPDLPSRDLYLSPEHALFIDGVLVPAGELVNSRSIVQMESVNRLEYFHIELEDHGVIYAEGAAAETFVDCDNRAMFDNGHEFAALYPNDKRATWDFCATRVERGSEELNAVRTALLARAEALGCELTEDPDLHLIVDGQIVRAQSIANNRHRFAIPAGATAVWLASRTAIPAEVTATSRDRRRLGVCVTQISLRDEYMSFDVDYAYPDFSEGFYDAERSHRWTNGRARLPERLLKPFAGEVTLEVRVNRSPLGYPKESGKQRAAFAA